MYSLNLPKFAINITRLKHKRVIFDILRNRFVALTPEEWVRQHFIHYLLEHKGYPAGLLANEVSLKLNGQNKRCDSVLYDTTLHPRMIIEYKAPMVTLSQKVFTQISTYNLILQVDYLIVSNGLQHYCCKMDYEHQSFQFLQNIPDYSELK